MPDGLMEIPDLRLKYNGGWNTNDKNFGRPYGMSHHTTHALLGNEVGTSFIYAWMKVVLSILVLPYYCGTSKWMRQYCRSTVVL
jgi:hypothetical protein